MDVDEILDAQAQREILETLVRDEIVRGAALGIAKQALEKGMDSLSVRQREVFDKVIGRYFNLECRRCGHEIPLCEVQAALFEGDGLCSWCRHMNSKDD